MDPKVWTWEHDEPGRWRALVAGADLARRFRGPLLLGAAFLTGVLFAGRGPTTSPHEAELSNRLRTTEIGLTAKSGELELLRSEVDRLTAIIEYSAAYRVPANLAAKIHDIALAEGIDADLAFRLVRVESGFAPNAVSPVGAVGLAQVMPRTAFELDPSLSYRDLFDPRTNLHLGFRYLSLMLERYDGDLRLALLAYNRGPGTVDTIRRHGGDPENGYSYAVLGSRPG